MKANDVTTSILKKIKNSYKVEDFDFTIQVIVTAALSQEKHTWISSISSNLSEKQLKKIIEEAKI